MGGNFTKPPKNGVAIWQRFDTKGKSWKSFSAEASFAIEEAFAQAAEENIYIIADGSEYEGDQIMFLGDLAERLGGTFVHRSHDSGDISEIRRVCVQYVFTNSSSNIQPIILPSDTTDTIAGKASANGKLVADTMYRLPGSTVKSIVTTQLGTSELYPAKPNETLQYETEGPGSKPIRLNGRGDDFSTFTVDGSPSDKFVRVEYTMDSTASRRVQAAAKSS